MEVFLLPFLKPKQIGSVIMAARQKKSGEVVSDTPEAESSPELMSAVESLISAVHMKDSKAAADAFKAAFEALEAKEEKDESVDE
jgi:regulator of RNase E activity RraB